MYMALTMFAYKTLIAIQGMAQSCHIASIKCMLALWQWQDVYSKNIQTG